MIEIWYSKEFLRMYGKLDPALQHEVKKRIEEFKDRKNHRKLEVHKLGFKLKGKLGFSIDFHNRVVFHYDEKDDNIAYLLGVGDHEIYRKLAR
jgi:hypothetical protein